MSPRLHIIFRQNSGSSCVINVLNVQGVREKSYILISCYFSRLVGGIDVHYTSLESLDHPSFIYVMTERMDDCNPPESWKRITCIMRIHTSHQSKETTAAAQCSLNTVKTTRHELENNDGDYEAVARRKQHNRRSTYSRISRKSAGI